MAQIDLGKLKLKNKGTWASSTTYEVDDFVVYTDSGVTSTYIYINASAAAGEVPSSGGTVNSSHWQIMAKGTDAVGMSFGTTETADFTASGATGYFIDTTAGVISMTLPASPSKGDQIQIIDKMKTFHTNHLKLVANGSYIQGEPDDWSFVKKGTNVMLTYGDANMGWQFSSFSHDDQGSMNNAVSSDIGSKRYIRGTSDAEEVYLDGDYMVHKFLSSGTFTVHEVGTDSVHGAVVRYMIVGGGGSGGTHHSGGGGAGAFRDTGAYNHTVSAQAYTITVGAGGSLRTSGGHGNNGSSSTFDSITSAGGGGGGSYNNRGRDGGSGGGAGHSHTHGGATGQGSGTRGGDHNSHTTGGGGGSTHRGGDAYGGGHQGGSGGTGNSSDITGKQSHFSGGGGGGTHQHGGGGGGGLGGGGEGQGGSARDNSGGGGGGTDGSSGQANYGGAGGSGIVVIRYKVR